MILCESATELLCVAFSCSVPAARCGSRHVLQQHLKQSGEDATAKWILIVQVAGTTEIEQSSKHYSHVAFRYIYILTLILAPLEYINAY